MPYLPRGDNTEAWNVLWEHIRYVTGKQEMKDIRGARKTRVKKREETEHKLL